MTAIVAHTSTWREVENNIDVLSAKYDPMLFGRCFRDRETQGNWDVFLKALFGLPLSEAELEAFEKFTGRKLAPKLTREAWLIVGRRGGKSLTAALLAVYLACFRDYSAFLGPGERANVMVIAADRRQARVILRYVIGFLETVPMMVSTIERRTHESIDLTNRVTIEVHTANFRSIRGYTLVAAICDEIAFWRSEDSANPDFEILNGLRPGLATIPGSLLLCLSSAYSRRGALWNAYQRNWAKDDSSVLVWKADSRSMNPTIAQEIIDQAYAEDPEVAAAEWGAEFRRDIETFVSREAVDAVTIPSRFELPFTPEHRYFSFVDPAGGSGSDSMTLAIAHQDSQKKFILDAVREERPPFSPEQVTARFAETLKAYKCWTILGDKYASEWPREQCRKHGITYQVSEKTKSEIYGELLPLLNSARVELLDNQRLISQLCSLERRTARGGKDSIDHAPHGHDDLINAAAGALVSAERKSQRRARMIRITGL